MIRTYVAPYDGDRYYDLSAHTQEEAEQLAPALIDFGNLPCRLPDERWLYPAPPKQFSLFEEP